MCALPDHVQSPEFDAGGLHWRRRKVSRWSVETGFNWAQFDLHDKGCEYLSTCDFLAEPGWLNICWALCLQGSFWCCGSACCTGWGSRVAALLWAAAAPDPPDNTCFRRRASLAGMQQNKQSWSGSLGRYSIMIIKDLLSARADWCRSGETLGEDLQLFLSGW